MPLGFREKRGDYDEQAMRTDGCILQLAPNGLLITSNNSDATYKLLVARELGLPDDTPWGETLEHLANLSLREMNRTLTKSAVRWCEDMSLLLDMWFDALRIRQVYLIGIDPVALVLAQRILRTWAQLEAWNAVPRTTHLLDSVERSDESN